jgi:hypothetical protein
MQACGSKQTSFMKTARALYAEQGGFLRFWKGAQAIVTGCLPADAAYFTSYEVMKRYFNYNNDDYEILKTGTIGAAATITHDMFIAPSDSKNYYL